MDFFLVSACLDGKPMLRNGETGDWIGTFIGHKGAVWSAHLNSDITQAITGSADYTAKLWDALSGTEIHNFNHGRIVKSVRFSNDNKQILTGGQDKILRLFDLSQPDSDPLKLEGHTQSIKVALWSNDQNTIISAGQEQGIRVWDVRTLSQVKLLNTKSPVSNIEISLDKKHITTTSGKEVNFWDVNTFDLLKSYTLPIELNSAGLSPDATTFAVGGTTDFWVRVYDFVSFKEIEILKGHHGPVLKVSYSPDGETIASGSEDGTIRLWQTQLTPKPYGLWQESKEKDTHETKV